jgi:CDP-paratose 2-epimerase
MRILITGGAGFVGSAMARYLKQTLSGSSVVAFDNLKRRGSELNLALLRESGIEFVHGDVRSRADLSELKGNFDLLIEASAEPSVHSGTGGSPDYVVETNLTGAFNCLDFARHCGSKFILLSTSRVYSIQPLRGIQLTEGQTRFEISDKQTISGITREGISEEFPTHLARSFYGASKLGAEQMVQEFSHTYGLKALILRCGVIAGPGQFGKADQGVFTMWVAHHYFKLPVRYIGFGGEGKQVRDLLHIQDLCELTGNIVDSLEKHSGDVWNVGGGIERSISLMELTALCRRVVGNSVTTSGISETAGFDVPVYVSDCRKMFARSNWRPKHSVETLVADILQWIRANEKALKPIFT